MIRRPTVEDMTGIVIRMVVSVASVEMPGMRGDPGRERVEEGLAPESS